MKFPVQKCEVQHPMEKNEGCILKKYMLQKGKELESLQIDLQDLDLRD